MTVEDLKRVSDHPDHASCVPQLKRVLKRNNCATTCARRCGTDVERSKVSHKAADWSP